MNIYKLTIESNVSDSTVPQENRFSNLEKVIDNIKYFFTDEPNTPSIAQKITIEIIPPYRVMSKGGMEDNPDWKI